MRRPGPEEWKTLLTEYEASGLTQKEFAAKHDVSVNTLQYWLYRRLKRKSVWDSETSANFVAVEVVPSPALEARASKPAAATPSVEVELRGGVVLRLAAGTPVRFAVEL